MIYPLPYHPKPSPIPPQVQSMTLPRLSNKQANKLEHKARKNGDKKHIYTLMHTHKWNP